MPSVRKLSGVAHDRLTVTLDAAMRVELNRIVEEEGHSLAWIARRAIKEYLARTREKKDAESKT